MFQLHGRVVALDRHRDNYAVMALRREQSGLLGSTIKVLVPPLVLVRDGEPRPGAYVDVGAQSLAEAGVSRREWDCLLVARYLGELDGQLPDDQDEPPTHQQLRRADGNGG